MGMIDRHIQSEIDWNTVSRLDIIGIDEISLKKGHKDFVAIITGRVNKKTFILGVLADRTKATVKLFLSRIPHKLRTTIQAVCSGASKSMPNNSPIFGSTLGPKILSGYGSRR